MIFSFRNSFWNIRSNICEEKVESFFTGLKNKAPLRFKEYGVDLVFPPALPIEQIAS